MAHSSSSENELFSTALTQHTNAIMDLVEKIFRYNAVKQNENLTITEHARFSQHSNILPALNMVHTKIDQAWQEIEKAIDMISKLLFTPSNSVRARKQALEETPSQQEVQKPTMQHVAKEVVDKITAHQNTTEVRLKEVEWNIVKLLESEMKKQTTVSVGAIDNQNAPSMQTLHNIQYEQAYFQRQLEISQQHRNTTIQGQHEMGCKIKQDFLGVKQDLIDHIGHQDKAEENRKQQYADFEQERDHLKDDVHRVKEQYDILALQADTEREANEQKFAEIGILD